MVLQNVPTLIPLRHMLGDSKTNYDDRGELVDSRQGSIYDGLIVFLNLRRVRYMGRFGR